MQLPQTKDIIAQIMESGLSPQQTNPNFGINSNANNNGQGHIDFSNLNRNNQGNA